MGSAPPFWRKPNFLNYWLPPLLWGLAVPCLSGDLGSGKNTLGILRWLFSWFVDLKPAQINQANFYVRKTGHVLAYGLMYFLWFRAFRAQAHYKPWPASLWSLGLCLLYASMDEGRQWFYDTRGASIRDVILDMSGASLTALQDELKWSQEGLQTLAAGTGAPASAQYST